MKISEIENINKDKEKDKEILKYVLLRPKMLNNETIALLFDKKYLNEIRQKLNNITVYFLPEIKELSKHKYDDETIRIIHAFKKMGCWICPS
jgi:hypothetical protein